MSDLPITSPDYWRDLADETRDKANRYASERERFLRVAEETKDSLSVLRSGSAMRRWSGQRVTELLSMANNKLTLHRPVFAFGHTARKSERIVPLGEQQ